MRLGLSLFFLVLVEHIFLAVFCILSSSVSLVSTNLWNLLPTKSSSSFLLTRHKNVTRDGIFQLILTDPRYSSMLQ